MIKLTVEQEKSICDMYINGLNSKEIAKIFNVSTTPIVKIIHKNNIMRTHSEVRKRQIPPMLGKHQTEYQKNYVSENNWTKTKEGKIKLSQKTKKLWENENYRIKMTKILNSVASHPNELNPNWKGGKDMAGKRRQEKRKKYISNPLNEKFLNSEEHHTDKITTIYLPKEIHGRKFGIIHNLQTGYCMNVINTMAYFFLLQQNIQELSNIFKK